MKVNDVVLYEPVQTRILPRRILFLSDLHFDFTDGDYNQDMEGSRLDDFWNDLQKVYRDGDVVCLTGDFFNDYRKTLRFIRELEKAKIQGFFVLGNHDYWNDGSLTLTDIIQIFENETKNNKYFRLLTTGRKYYVDDLCFIGDTGWSSFRHRYGRDVEFYKSVRLGFGDYNDFYDLPVRYKGEIKKIERMLKIPEFDTIKNFTLYDVLKLHHEWIDFANGVYDELGERNVITLTHYPMISFGRSDKDTWWSSVTGLRNISGWCIYGHTHDRVRKYYNHITHQRGYGRKQGASFGELSLIDESSNLSTVTTPALVNTFMAQVYDTSLVVDTNDVEQVKMLQRRGFSRSSANRKNMSALIHSKDKYLDKVRSGIDSFLNKNYGGYEYKIESSQGLMGDEDYRYRNITREFDEDIKFKLDSVIEIIERGDMSDLRAYMSAVVVTGYAYNNVLYELYTMRPLDDFDILRLALVFYTIQLYGLNVDDVDMVRKSERKHGRFEFRGVPIFIPKLNNKYEMSKDEMLLFMDKYSEALGLTMGDIQLQIENGKR